MNAHDLLVPTSDGDEHGAGDASPSPAPTPPEPFTEAEFDSIIGTIWNGLPDDPRRFDDLLAEALGFIAAVALRPDLTDTAGRAVGLLRRMEQRSLWGPDHEQEDHR